MKKLCIGLALAAVLALGLSTPAMASYDHDILNPEVAANQLTLRTDTDAIGCYVLADDSTHIKPVVIPCSNFAAVGSQAFTGATTFGSTVGITGLLTATGGISGGSGSNIAINTNKFTVAASSGNTVVAGTLGVTGALTASGGVDGVLGGVTPAAVTTTALTVGTSIDTHAMTFGSVLIGNPLTKVVVGTCTTAAVNGGTCIPLAATASRTITVTNFDIVAAGSAATCTGILLEDTNGTPVVVATLAAATLTSGGHNAPLAATLGAGFGAGAGLTAGAGFQIIKNGSDCATTTSFKYAITYAVQ